MFEEQKHDTFFWCLDVGVGQARNVVVVFVTQPADFAAKWMAKWLESTGDARAKVQFDAEQSIEHFLKAVKSIWTTDLVVQRAPVKCRASVERAVRLVEN